MRSHMLPLTLSATLAIGGLAHAAEPIEVAPLRSAAPWVIEIDESECRMSRRFGSDNAPAWVQINRDGPLSSYSLAVSSSDLPKRPGFDAEIRFDGDENWTQSQVARSTTASGEDFSFFQKFPMRFGKG